MMDMPARLFKNVSSRLNAKPLPTATLKERVTAQIIDGVILGALYSLLLFMISGGRAWSLWVSPVFPLYLLQGAVLNYPDPNLWFWGGYGVSLKIPGLAPVYLAFPTPLWIAVYLIYYIGFYSRFGQTPGKMVRGLVLLDNGGKIPGVKSAFWHWLGGVAALLTLGYGLWGRNPAWPEQWSGTRVYRFSVFDAEAG